MWPRLCVSQKAYFRSVISEHHYTPSPRLVFCEPKKITALLRLFFSFSFFFFIAPALLIPNTTSAVGACYIFTGNSGERQRQTWIAEVTRRERTHECLLCMGVRSAANNQRTDMSSIASDYTCCQENHPGHYEDGVGEGGIYTLPPLHWLACNELEPGMSSEMNMWTFSLAGVLFTTSAVVGFLFFF